MTGEVVTREQEFIEIVREPADTLADARKAATVLMQVVTSKPKQVIINGEKYLEYEDWQTLGQFYGYTVITGEAVPVEVEGVKGARAIAKLVRMRDGLVLGGAEAYCMRDEERWCARKKYEWQGEGDDRTKVEIGEENVPWFQLASMAQTRAGSKAYRNRLAWVAVLAGYRPTPAEEMEGVPEKSKRATSDTGEHFCKIHNVAFFKSKNMKSYAHPYEENGEKKWCNEPADTAQPNPTATKEQPDLMKLEFKNAGEFMTACYENFKLDSTMVNKEVPEYDIAKPDQRKKAWQQIVGTYQKS